jgi:hypothetical protein
MLNKQYLEFKLDYFIWKYFNFIRALKKIQFDTKLSFPEKRIQKLENRKLMRKTIETMQNL